MTGTLATLIPYMERFGYWAVAGAIFPEGFGIPMPGETALIVASILASRGDMPFVPILAAAFLAALAGNTVGYGLGFYGGRPLVIRYGRYLFVTGERLRKTEQFFRQYGQTIVLVARFLDVFRQLNGLVAGVTRMPFLRFQVYNVLGAALWVGCWGGLAYELGHKVESLHEISVIIRYGVLIALFIALTIVIAGRVKGHFSKKE